MIGFLWETNKVGKQQKANKLIFHVKVLLILTTKHTLVIVDYVLAFNVKTYENYSNISSRLHIYKAHENRFYHASHPILFLISALKTYHIPALLYIQISLFNLQE